MKSDQQRHPSARSRVRRIGPVALIIVALAGLAIVAPKFRGQRSPDSAVETLQRQLREELPVGSDRAAIEAWAIQHEYRFRFQALVLDKLPAPPATMLQEISGMPRENLSSFAELLTDWGTYKVWRTGETAENKLWVFLPLDEEGRVTGHYCLTLKQLAEHERRRELAKKIGEANGIGDK